MSSIVPSPFSRLADTFVSGLVSTAAQTFAGVKTFAALIVASAGIQVASLFNTNGTGASDVGVKIGVSTADASVNASAKLLSARTGVGGVEVERFFVRKGTQATGFELGHGATGSLTMNDSVGIQLIWNSTVLSIDNNTARLQGNVSTVVRSNSGTGASDVCNYIGTTVADGSVNNSAKLLSIGTGSGGTYVEKNFFTKGGNFSIPYGAALYFGAISSGAYLFSSGTSVIELGTSNTAAFRLNGGVASFFGYLTRQSAPFGIYANGTTGITETVRLVGQRGDSGLKCVVAGTEQASPNAAAVLFQTAKGISVTANNDAGNGTALGLQVMGDGHSKARSTLSLNEDGVAKPTAGAAYRGTLWYSKSAGGAADTVEICLKSAADTYSWVVIATG